MNCNDDGDIVIQRIVVTRMLTADGGDGYSVECDSEINILPDLGMLEAAKLTLMDMYHYSASDEDEEVGDE